MWFWKSPPADAASRTQDTPSSQSSCPVDHTARAAWLDQARNAQPSAAPPPIQDQQSYDASRLPRGRPSLLSSDRQVSTIPRAPLTPSSPPPQSHHSQAQPAPPPPANSEHESAADAASGNWIYPSEQMFFDAMRRKNHAPRARDMRAIVPIHNAVNERAWAEIKAWERGQGGDACGGPRLVSFRGSGSSLASAAADAAPGLWQTLTDRNLSPRARWNVLAGATPPFDRHDWVVERCGTRLEYVIDFYAGKPGRGADAGKLSFYLDVRPKLNSWEGWRMRALRAVGLGGKSKGS